MEKWKNLSKINQIKVEGNEKFPLSTYKFNEVKVDSVSGPN